MSSTAVPFTEAVERVVASIPPGEVLTYGEVAAEAGYPGAARAVGNVMARSDGRIPCWRVVRAGGRFGVGKERTQGQRLRDEGVELSADGSRVVLPSTTRRPARSAPCGP